MTMVRSDSHIPPNQLFSPKFSWHSILSATLPNTSQLFSSLPCAGAWMNRRKFLYTTAATAAAGLVPNVIPSLAGESIPKPDYTLRIVSLKLELAPGTVVETVAYNGTVPGPLLRLQQGKETRIRVINETDTPELAHWHGLDTDSINDGAMEQGSSMIAPHGE